MKHSIITHLTEHSPKHMMFKTPGKYAVFFHNISGDFRFEILSPQVELDIFGLYTGKKNTIFKVTTTQHHRRPNSQSNLLIKGVFDDASQFTYAGLIRIEKNARQSHAYQKNNNLLLSPRVFVSSKPDLEILAHDVYCTHGSTTGKINQEDRFYIQSRGLDQKAVTKLVVRGFIEDLFCQMREKGYEADSETFKKLCVSNDD